MAKKKPAFLQRIAADKDAEVMAPAVRGTRNTKPGGDPAAAKKEAAKSVGVKKKRK